VIIIVEVMSVGAENKKDLEKVEELRNKLNILAKQKGTLDDEVIYLSKLLDILINQYYTMNDMDRTHGDS
jgi:hypothetical protein